jgi:hypothetical protein
MLSQIDKTICPDSCEVVEIPSSQQHVFLIFKNASSSIRMECERQSGKHYNASNVTELADIDVYLRQPRARYVSGVNTFLQNLLKENSKLDQQTILFFVRKFHFLNLHYLPQFHWLLNLNRFNNHCRLTLHDVDDVATITDYYDQPIEILADDRFEDLLQIDAQVELWFFLDNILRELIGKTLTFVEILEYIKLTQPKTFDIIFKDHLALLQPAYVLSKT